MACLSICFSVEYYKNFIKHLIHIKYKTWAKAYNSAKFITIPNHHENIVLRIDCDFT